MLSQVKTLRMSTKCKSSYPRHHSSHYTHYTLHTTHYTLHTTYYTLHTTQYPNVYCFSVLSQYHTVPSRDLGQAAQPIPQYSKLFNACLERLVSHMQLCIHPLSGCPHVLPVFVSPHRRDEQDPRNLLRFFVSSRW